MDPLLYKWIEALALAGVGIALGWVLGKMRIVGSTEDEIVPMPDHEILGDG